MTKSKQGPYHIDGSEQDNIASKACQDFWVEVCGPNRVNDAHLLAASWDMYHALERALDKIEDLQEVYSPHTTDVINSCRAALAKARGES